MSPGLHALIVVCTLTEASSILLTDELTVMNSQLLRMNAVTARLAWEEATEPDNDAFEKKLKLAEVYAEWRNFWCRKLRRDFESGVFRKHAEIRQFYLLCRGPIYKSDQARELSEKLTKLRQVHHGKVCREDEKCVSEESDVENLVATSRDPEILLRAWIEWRNAFGESSRKIFAETVKFLNEGAKNNGYRDIGECWREELEVDDLEQLVDNLYQAVEPLYTAFHAVVRYKLNLFYGSDLVSLNEAIPAHLLGNVWDQNWGRLIDLVMGSKVDDMNSKMKKKNYSVTDLVKRSEDFYLSLGFPPMTDKFWKNSKFTNDDANGSVCHASAANMFEPDDFRMIVCADANAEAFQIINHEMGHIQYFMEYRHQPAIFQQGTNPAFQEAIGNAIANGITTPSHQQRLGLIKEVAEPSDLDWRILLGQALSKLPEIPFALALEKWRWNVFRGEIGPEKYNEAWWYLKEKYQGVKAPVSRSEEFFDPAANFHISNNVPYIRYFLSSILEMQIFEALCKGAIYGRDRMNETLSIPLHRCDIYGSKEGAENLRAMMSLGGSIHWSDALEMVTGKRSYSAKPLLNYYRPLYVWLMKEIEEYKIPVGW